MTSIGSWRRAAVLALAALAAGCDLVYPWSGSTAPVAPQALQARLESFDAVALGWAPADGATLYEVGGRVAGGEWASLGRTPGRAPYADVQLDPSVPEAVALGFRVRALVGDTPSEWSAEAVVTRGVRPASVFTANFVLWPGRPGTPVQLTWRRGSTAATALVLERRTTRGGVEASPWAPLAGVGVADESYLDEDTAGWLDGLRFEYRLHYVLGSIESVPVGSWSDAAPPAPAVGLAASNDGSLAVHLSWTPMTAVPTARQVLTRKGSSYTSPEQEIATLDRTVTSYDDRVPAGGGYTYRILTRVTGAPDTASEPASVVTGIGPFLPSTVDLPGIPVDRDAEGRFTVVSEARSTTDPLHVWLPDVSGWIEQVLGTPGSTWIGPRYLRAPDGTVSVFYFAGYYTTPSRAWHDGTGWHSEPLSFVPGNAKLDATVDAGGALHVVLCGVYFDLTYATNRSGAWVTEAVPHGGLPPPYGGLGESCAIAIGADGEPRIAYATPRKPVPGGPWLGDAGLVVHGASGWTEGPAPVTGFDYGPTVFRLLATAGGATLFFEAPNAHDVQAYDLGPSGWSAPVGLGSAGGQFAVSPDGTRLATWSPSLDGPGVAVRDAAGTWTTWSLPGYTLMGLGFDPSGKLWVAIQPGPPPTTIVYTER